MKKKTIFILIFILIFTACGSGVKIDEMEFEYKKLEFFKIEQEGDVYFEFFTMIDDTRLAVLAFDFKNLSTAKIYNNGNLYKEKVLEKRYMGLCYGDNSLFTFNQTESTLEKFNMDLEVEKILLHDFDFVEIKNLSYSDNKLFFIVVHNIDEDYLDKINDASLSGDYMSFGEIAYMYDLETNELKDLKINNVIAQALAPDDNIYYYCFSGNKYQLQKYSIDTGKVENVTDINNVGYAFGFIFYNDIFLYSDNMTNLRSMNLSTNLNVIQKTGTLTYGGGDMQFYKGNLIILNRNTANIEILSLFVAEDDENMPELKHRGEEITIGSRRNENEFIEAGIDCGISASIYKFPLDLELIKMKLLAGDSDIDIYVLTPDFYIPSVINNGQYVPFNDSGILSSHVNNCFDYIKDYFTTENGDIWAAPLTINTDVTWYVPENMEKFNLTYDDVKTFDSYMDTLKRLKNNTGEYLYFNFSENLHYYLHEKYDINYNDFKNGFADYNTDIYRNFFDLMRTGWVRFSSKYEDHPYFNSPVHNHLINRDEGRAPQSFDKNVVIFQTDSVIDYIEFDNRENLNNWRAFPTPIFINESEKNPVNMNFAVVNPNSEKIEAATEYLEYLVSNTNEYLGNKGSFLMKDRSTYTNFYDINSPCFNDLYEIFANGAINETPYPSWEAQGDIIVDYQNERLTLDDVVSQLNRIAEMAMNE